MVQLLLPNMRTGQTVCDSVTMRPSVYHCSVLTEALDSSSTKILWQLIRFCLADPTSLTPKLYVTFSLFASITLYSMYKINSPGSGEWIICAWGCHRCHCENF